MSWIGVRDQRQNSFNPAGLDTPVGPLSNADRMLPQGSILFEFASIPGATDQLVFQYFAADDRGSNLEFSLNTNGDFLAVFEDARATQVLKLPTKYITRSESITVRLSWDLEQSCVGLSFEVMETGEVHFQKFECEFALSVRDAVRMIKVPKSCILCVGTTFFAVADHTIPHGPLPSLLPTTTINSDGRTVRLRDLRIGDVLVDAFGDKTQVRWVGEVQLPARGRFAPRQICEPFYNITSDFICGYDQRIRLSGSEVEYLFATNQVAAKVGHLQRGLARTRLLHTSLMTYAHFVLDRPTALNANGLLVEGMDVSVLRGNTLLKNASVLSKLPNELFPSGQHKGRLKLRDFETAAWSNLQAA